MTRYARFLPAILLAVVLGATGARVIEASGPTVVSPQPSGIQVGPCGVEQQPTIVSAVPQQGPTRATPSTPPVVAMKTATELKAHPMLGAVGDTVHLRATLTLKEGATPVPSHTVHFRVDGQAVGVDKTDAKGEAKLPYKVPNSVGAKKIEASYLGSAVCAGSKDDANFGAIKSSTKLTLSLSNPSQTLREGSTVQVQGKIVRITDQDGLDGREIPVKVDGKHISNLATSSNGNFSFSYKIPDNYGVKSGTVEARFEGDGLYVPTAASIGFSVHADLKKAYLTWTGAEGKVGQTVTVDVFLSESYPVPTPGKGIGGKTVRVWRDRGPRWAAPHFDAKQLGSAVTNSNGVAKVSFKIDDQALPYTLSAHADGILQDFDVEKKSDPQLKVHKTEVTVGVSGPGEGSIGSTLAMKARVRRTTDDAPVKNVDVQVPGGTFKTNDSGEVSFNYTISAGGGTGPRTIEAKAKEGLYSLAGTGTKTIQAKPKTN
ncbi:MAG TPA: Ig-like domain repeat protein [Methylomirabilota bacterium]|jgi:hypothetical protein|nr:Ig-like domain repeat protein [Methylomirabilota bacterium]